MTDRGQIFHIAPQYPEPMEMVTDINDPLDTEEEANEVAWEWRGAGFYATRKRYKGGWAVFVCDGREMPAPMPKDPTKSWREQG